MSSNPSYFSQHPSERKVSTCPLIRPVIACLHQVLCRPRKEPAAEAFVSFLPAWNTIKSLVWNTNTSLQTTAGIPAVPRSHERHSSSTTGTGPPALPCPSQSWHSLLFPCAPLWPSATFCIRFHLRVYLKLKLKWFFRTHVDRWGHNDGLSLFAAAPVGWRGDNVNYMRCFIRRDRRCHILCKFMMRTCESVAVKPVRFHLSLEANRKTLFQKNKKIIEWISAKCSTIAQKVERACYATVQKKIYISNSAPANVSGSVSLWIQ